MKQILFSMFILVQRSSFERLKKLAAVRTKPNKFGRASRSGTKKGLRRFIKQAPEGGEHRSPLVKY